MMDDADTVHAEAAREMVLRHDWVTLRINGVVCMMAASAIWKGPAHVLVRGRQL